MDLDPDSTFRETGSAPLVYEWHATSRFILHWTWIRIQPFRKTGSATLVYEWRCKEQVHPDSDSKPDHQPFRKTGFEFGSGSATPGL